MIEREIGVCLYYLCSMCIDAFEFLFFLRTLWLIQFHKQHQCRIIYATIVVSTQIELNENIIQGSIPLNRLPPIRMNTNYELNAMHGRIIYILL